MDLFDQDKPVFKFDKNKKIRFISLFSGVGFQELGLKYLGVPFEYHKAIEFDKYACMAYNAVHGQNIQPTDIRNVKGEDLEIVDKSVYQYVLTYSFPCGLAGTKIRTEDGFKNIEDVKIGEKVLTHKNRYRKVVKTMNRIAPSYNVIKTLGQPELKLTDNHPLYVLRDGEIQWVKVCELKLSDMVCYNINQTEIDTKCSDDILWLLGRYAADGHINKYSYNSVNFAVGNNKVEEFERHIPRDMNMKSFQKKGCIDYRVADLDFQELCMEIGTGSNTKEIPSWILDLPKNKVKIFLDGYLSGDGHKRDDSHFYTEMFTTTSKTMYLGLQELLAKYYGIICSSYLRKDKRSVNFNDTYNCQYSVNGKSSQQKVINNQIFVPIRNITHIDEAVPVYNFEVEEDNSYTCESIVVHNCTDLSGAGTQKGMSKGSGTRSGLLWEVERLLNETEELPDVLIMENVSAIHQKKFMSDFQKWIDYLSSKGYSNYWQDLNTKDFDIPQNRNRCYMISILGNYRFDFPKAIIPTKKMEDLLVSEEEVAEKFYLNKVKTERLLTDMKDKGALPL